MSRVRNAVLRGSNVERSSLILPHHSMGFRFRIVRAGVFHQHSASVGWLTELEHIHMTILESITGHIFLQTERTRPPLFSSTVQRGPRNVFREELGDCPKGCKKHISRLS